MAPKRDSADAESHGQRRWRDDDLGKEAPCEKCSAIGRVVRGWPSMKKSSPIVCRCPLHMPEDDFT